MTIDTNNGIRPGHNANTATGRTQTTATRPGADSKSPSSKPVERSDVVLSQEAQSLGRLEDKINALPEINSERVAEIRQAIAEGRIKINAERMAENLLDRKSTRLNSSH